MTPRPNMQRAINGGTVVVFMFLLAVIIACYGTGSDLKEIIEHIF